MRRLAAVWYRLEPEAIVVVPTGFNPYVQWLGRAEGRPPTNYYDLLGLAAFESDPAVISRQAEAIASRLHSIHPGEHLTEWQRMLDAVGAARACLLDPAAKEAYDARLRAEALREGPGSGSIPSATPQACHPAICWSEIRRMGVRMVAVAGCTALVVVAAASYYQARQEQLSPQQAAASQQSDQAGEPQSPRAPERGRRDSNAAEAAAVAEQGLAAARTPGEPAPPLGTHTGRQEGAIALPPGEVQLSSAAPQSPISDSLRPSNPTEPMDRAAEPRPAAPDRQPVAALANAGPSVTPAGAAAQPPAGGPSATTPPAGAANAPVPQDPAKLQSYRQAVTAIRTALGRRDLSGAKRQLRAAAQVAEMPDQQAELARLERLSQYLEQFQKTLGKVVASLIPAQEFTIANTPAIVVEASDKRLTLRSEGRNHSYAVNNLPRAVVDALVETSFPDDPATKVMYGTYLALDPQGDRHLARKLWEEALAAGEDIRDLLVEIDQAPPVASAKPTPGRTTMPKTDVPAEAEALRKAEQAVRAEFEVDYQLASSGPGKLKLAEKLMEAAGRAELAPENRFVMLRDASDLALAASKPEVACKAIDQMATFFTVDPLEMKLAAIERFAKMARTTAANRDLLDSALDLIDPAVKAGRLDQAGRLAAVAIAAAQRVKNPALLRKAREAKDSVDAALKQDADRRASKKN